MQLAIPSAPRPVRLRQVPGALPRVVLVAVLGLLVTAALWGLGRLAATWLSGERDFLARAVEVPGTVAEVRLPPLDQREGGVAHLRVLYTFGGGRQTASELPMDALEAEGLGPGATVQLLVDPAKPTVTREARWAWRSGGTLWLKTAGLGLGGLVALLLIARELRRALRRELQPLRVGALVWLTPDAGELPAGRAGLRFPAHYFRDDVKHAVTARARPGRAPVRNGSKLLAAVVPSEPTWVRVIDEELARSLGWYRSG